jgi:predicted O-linked N-acetylglucosamine transferase (SPINDLY family)
LDVLVFPSMGMHQATYMWAHSRMARVVVGTWGHPVTSGLPAVDYFVSSDLFEPSSPDDNHRYSEQLVRFKSTGFYFPVPPGSEALARDAAAVSLPRLDELLGGISGPLVACPQALMKLHPAFDAALAGILRGHPAATLVLLHDPSKPQQAAWRKKVERRLSGALGADASGRVVFLPRLAPIEFLGLLRRAALVLDPFPFGGGVTSLEAFAVCAPIVTAPPLQTVPALAAGMYRRMGLASAPVVRNEGEYVGSALELLQNNSARARLAAAICDRRPILFEDEASVEEWAAFLRHAAMSP